mmetsp:Transcript_2045/g.2627  ORF Transcript_2045/g.2627 Transcript_2045/m.2627 type:complete len:477 (+) Transcript_2045:57-1487(+)|eukprot:CAMPEP_0204832186 /NCGR_PEP_ID=MMETSP1346-20131115/12860_1 /ASSEMBLY_ACC=CAM_ASM_000771 /TAXON_ID=215587 /ORGANISM="Aplanochytrium stocchinoi, Strain GSBS06" /LENGTH=476 /DNA_ID=CAMNT_0051963829 /DNA_START=146 /DNA_END=1576 /DNA_ORIENTATION=-
MYRFFSLVVAGLLAVQANGKEFSVCRNHLEKMGVVNIQKFDISPNEPTAGSTVQFTLSGGVSKALTTGTIARVVVQVMGIELASHDFDICSLEGVSCPIAGEDNFEGTISHRIPFDVPEGVGMEVTVEFIDDQVILGCVEVEMKVQDPEGHNNRFGFDANEVDFLFKKWNIQHGFDFHISRNLEKFQIFKDNLMKIALHNAAGLPWKMGMNQFGHLTAEEFKKTYASGLFQPSQVARLGGESLSTKTVTHRRAMGESLPDSVNWVTAGAVTPVKNQGACGSCWAFSTTGALEGAYYIKYKKLVSFSEQDLVSCDHVDQGCNGGLMDNAYKFIEKNGGLCSEDDYPYTAGHGMRGWCRNSKCKIVPNSKPASYSDVEHKETSLESAVAKQPVAIAIEADQTAFQFYSKGVLNAKCGTNLDHGVLLVGYGADQGNDYWLVKNSWGPMWGDKGYIKLARGVSQEGGECGLLLSPSYPIF